MSDRDGDNAMLTICVRVRALVCVCVSVARITQQYGQILRKFSDLTHLDKDEVTVRGVDHGMLGVLNPLKICRRGHSMPRPPKMPFFHSKPLLDTLCKPHAMKDERLVKNGRQKPIFRGA